MLKIPTTHQSESKSYISRQNHYKDFLSFQNEVTHFIILGSVYFPFNIQEFIKKFSCEKNNVKFT